MEISSPNTSGHISLWLNNSSTPDHGNVLAIARRGTDFTLNDSSLVMYSKQNSFGSYEAAHFRARGYKFQKHDGTDYLAINDSGNVGIGLTNPSQSLEISGNMAIRDTHKIYFNHNTNTNRYIGASSTNDLDIAADDDINYRSNYHRFFNGSTEFARLSSSTNSWIANGSNGKLGIGKTNPAYNLDVTGSIYCTAAYVRASTAPDIWYSNNNTDTYTQTVLYMNQSNSSNTDTNGYFLERGRISNSSSAEIRRWVIGARGGQKQMMLDGPGTLTVAGDMVAYGS